ncbi:MAG TPA: hypothetical protein VLF40_06220 [Candidatus Saccharimonadales bacterium]|nr:hypothetical protein [Candidatus Saccharimonadales bacterium]
MTEADPAPHEAKPSLADRVSDYIDQNWDALGIDQGRILDFDSMLNLAEGDAVLAALARVKLGKIRQAGFDYDATERILQKRQQS